MSETHDETRPGGQKIANETTKQVASINRRAFSLIYGAQKIMVEEMLLAGSETLEQTRAEMHVSAELFSKVAEAHSVETLRTAYLECAQHQMDVFRQSGQQLFKHGQRMFEAASRILANPPQS